MLTDPIADMLTRLRNAAKARHPRADMPASKMKIEIARILKEEGYISTFKVVEESKVRKTLRVFLKYTPDRKPSSPISSAFRAPAAACTSASRRFVPSLAAWAPASSPRRRV